MNERFLRLLKKPGLLPVCVGIVGFGAGIGVGYVLGHRKNKKEVHEAPEQLRLDLDVTDIQGTSTTDVMENAESFIQNYYKEKGVPEPGYEPEQDPDNVATPAEAFILEYLPGSMVLKDEPEPHPIEAVAHSIFAKTSTDEWNYDEELKHRSSSIPYILHRDEFYAEEMDYTQSTYTYYSGDNIMVDEDDSPVYNYEDVVGPLRFGHGCDDPNVFHVRNDKRKAEYEIVFDSGLYSVEVLGLEIEDNQRAKNLKHSGPRKFKME